MLTAEERLLLHLLEHLRQGERYEVPFALTQSGISLAASVRRSHVSATIQDMERRGLVAKRMAHVEGGGRRRKAYVLTARGAQAAEALRQRTGAAAVTVRCGGSEKVMPLSEAVRLAPRGTGLLELALAVSGDVLDLDRAHALPPAGTEARRFYGRAAELESARRLLRSATTCLAVRGLPGVGKTAFLAKLAAADVPLLWVRVTEWTTPAQVIAAIAGRLRQAGHAGVSELRESGAGMDAVLSRLSEECRASVFHLFLDDVHKAPEDLVAFLEQLRRSFAGTKGKLVAAGRRIPVFYSRADVLVDRTVAEMELSGLEPGSALALLRDRGVPEERLLDLVAATKGHPLFLELVAASGGGGTDDVREYLRQEVAAKLQEREAELLAALSVHRQPVAPDSVVATVADTAKLEGLAERSLVKLGGGLVDVHDLLREFFYARLTAAQRLRLHAAAAGYYESRPQPEARIEQLFHLLKAGRSAPAAQLLAGMGHALAARGLQEDLLKVIALFDLRGMEIAERLPVLLLRGEILSTRGEWARAQESFAEAAALAEDAGDRRGLARAVLEIGVLDYRRGDFEAARTGFQRALDLIADRDEAVLARILNAFGILEWQAGNLDAAADLYGRSREAYGKAGDVAGVAGALNNLGILRWQQEDVDGALGLYAESLRLSEELGDDRTVAILYNNIGEAYRRKGDAPNAAKFYERSLELARKLEFLWQVGEVERNLGRLFTDSRGIEHLRKALTIFEALGARRDREEVAGLLRERGTSTS